MFSLVEWVINPIRKLLITPIAFVQQYFHTCLLILKSLDDHVIEKTGHIRGYDILKISSQLFLVAIPITDYGRRLKMATSDKVATKMT